MEAWSRLGNIFPLYWCCVEAASLLEVWIGLGPKSPKKKRWILVDRSENVKGNKFPNVVVNYISHTILHQGVQGSVPDFLQLFNSQLSCEVKYTDSNRLKVTQLTKGLFIPDSPNLSFRPAGAAVQNQVWAGEDWETLAPK